MKSIMIAADTCCTDEWPKGEQTRQSILNDFQEPWGDRRQEIVFIGERLDRKGLEVKLDSCLLTNSEMKKWERIMRLKRSPDTIQSKLDEAFEGKHVLFLDGDHRINLRILIF